MDLKYYSIHTTRNCNINCAHCLCGEPQNVDISEEVISSAFNGIDSISKLYITGGEVLLKPELIKMVVKEVKKRSIKVNRVAITTNALLLNDAAKEALLYAYELACFSFDKDLEVSVDVFHKKAVEQYIKKNNLQGVLSFEKIIQNAKKFCDDNEINLVLRDVKDGKIEKLGRAKNIKRAIETDVSFYAIPNYCPGIPPYSPSFDGVVSIDPTGEVIKCDFENDNVKEVSIGNVLKKPLEQIIYEKAVKELRMQIRNDTDFSDSESVKNTIQKEWKKSHCINNILSF